jgi:cysteine desulfurase/selenocysteine lyase
MILEVTKEKSSWNYLPWKFEAGTQNVSGVVGFGAAVDYLNKLGMKKAAEVEGELTSYAFDKLSKIKQLKIYGPNNLKKRIGVISFNITNQTGKLLHPHDVASILDGEGIAIRSGHHCAQPLMEVLGVEGTCRVSLNIYNIEEEIDTLILAIEKAKEILR